MKLKSCPVTVKSAGNAADAGVFEAIVSVFGNVDHYGDVVEAGAFLDTLAEWKASGDSIPVLWSHVTSDPRFNIGSVIEAEELAPGDARIPEWADQTTKDNGGLYVKGRIDTGPDASDVAVAALKLLKARRVTQFSYMYDIIDAGWVVVDGQDAYALRKLKLYEVSPTQVGANEGTELIGAKALVTDAVAILKAERALAKDGHGNIRKAVELLNETLTALDAPTTADPAPVGPEAKADDTAPTAELLRSLEVAELEHAVSL